MQHDKIPAARSPPGLLDTERFGFFFGFFFGLARVAACGGSVAEISVS